MRSIGKISFAVLTALAAMAFAGATPASALQSTQLCKVHTGLTCPAGEKITAAHMALQEGTVGKFLGSSLTILCLGVLEQSSGQDIGELAKPQRIDATALSFTGCGTSSAHDNCTANVEEQPDATLLKTGLDSGTLEFLNGRIRAVCSNLGINCVYDAAGLLFLAGAQHITANESPVAELGGKFVCPTEGTLDGLLKTLHAVTPSSTVLCKTHSSEICAEKDQVKSLHMVTTKPPVLYNTIANIECESSLATATVLAPAEVQKLDATELTWTGCHTQGAADNCTVTSKGLPTLDLKRTALNLGEATTLGLKVGIDCTVLGLIELECTFGSDVTLQAEGALHKEGVGHGKFTASKLVLKKLEGTGHCPESVKWDAIYEPLEHTYVLGSASSLSQGTAYILQ